MAACFDPLPLRDSLHTRITSVLALQVIEAERDSQPVLFPSEPVLCQQLGVSRTVLRESMKVLVDKGMVELKPRTGTRARPRSEWRLMDPDILRWQAEIGPEPGFLQDLCEVRLAIEPTAAGFAAVRASRSEVDAIEGSLRERETKTGTTQIDEIIDLDLSFHAAIVAASHNPLLRQLSVIIRQPFRTALAYTAQFPSTVELGLGAHHALLRALRQRDPMTARRAAEEVVGLAMLAVEKVVRSQKSAAKPGIEWRH